MRRVSPLPVCLLLISVAAANAAELPGYVPAPADNPLKGFVPYAGQARDFPHSLEFGYLPLRAVMTGAEQFDWQPLERLLQDVESRGCQTVVRFYVEYPNKPTAVPQFLLDAGVGITQTITGDDPRQDHSLTPDYSDARLRTALKTFIAALGARYDADPRIASVEAGLLGKWGEWHDYPTNQLWAAKAVQEEVMDAYEKAFHATPIVLRTPAGAHDPFYASNADRPFGYHDDSFAWATLPTGRPQDEWFFLSLMQKAGPDATNKWRRFPIGGEVRPEIWAKLWDEPSSTPAGQEFLKCVEQTHATWLLDSSIARPLTAAERDRALTGECRLGYEFYIVSSKLSFDIVQHRVRATVTVRNLGVAPFYADWPVRLAIANAKGKILVTWDTSWKLKGLSPHDPDRLWDHAASTQGFDAGQYEILVGVPNPMPRGRPLRFANQSQDATAPGWLTLGTVELK